jgi:hypothetical protein
MTVALGLLSTIDQDTPLSKILPCLMFVGAGAGCTFQTTVLAAQAAVARKDMVRVLLVQENKIVD